MESLKTFTISANSTCITEESAKYFFGIFGYSGVDADFKSNSITNLEKIKKYPKKIRAPS